MGAVLDRAVERRLAAILLTDVVGYSRMISEDETGTLRRLKALRRTVIEPQVAAAHGRIVKSTGDGVLVEFHSSVRAVGCAVTIQRATAMHNAGLPENQAMRMRIGINLGDVIAEPDGDLYGDGVNVAARLEPLAEPGGLCISRSIHDQVRDKLPYHFEDRGKLELKNIARPIGVFALSAEAIAASADLPEDEPDQSPQAAVASRRPLWLAGVAGVLGLAAAVGLGWWYRPAKVPTADHTLAVQAGLPPKPLPPLSLVVLPFANLSADPEQDFFADGLTEDLTTDLSHLAGSFVIARNTAFTYKGKAVDVKQVGRDLGVRYVLEGSVRRAADRVILNAQLISTETGAHLWADRFEGERSRLGDLQVEFVARLARSLDVQLTQAESLRTLRERPDNPNSADLAMRGWAALNRRPSPAHLQEALNLFELALQKDQRLTSALVGKARSISYMVWLRWSSSPAENLAAANEAITSVLSDAPEHAMAHFVKGEILKAQKKHDLAVPEFETAIRNDRNLAVAYEELGHTKILLGRSNEALPLIEKALRLSPHDPALNFWLFHMCHAFTHLGRDSEAIDWCRKSVAAGPLWLAYIDLSAAYAWTEQKVEAQDAVAELLKLMPGYTVQKWANAGFSDNPKFLIEYQRIVDGLRKAGLPEG
ncbi:adenylate/guanylate cyclase domain-containing protein [Methylobacterium sp. NEAU K]|uniref:adenylate/guanylate cyclase domain-containing protein n=1 Tax=Methylobacterium sp. NEAU K TaxID=3064946 RepID=UPI0027324A1E|nr:adenylate/guanylate cyclase domain-containing protein [Methylobacterium sp. NEAU K]MDP4006186.1 adenylate/guanylate cyclase domain-containing protein [Methylobacterium sp. NEAU K]